MKSHLRAVACTCLIAVVSQTAGAALVSRLGGQAVYDTDLNITWTADANLPATHTFGVSGISTNGSMTWKTSSRWIAAMNADGGKGYLGFNDWRRPSTLYPKSRGEMDHLSYTDFNAPAYGSVLHNGHPGELAKFTNIQPGSYWSGAWEVLNPEYYAWDFNFVASARGLSVTDKAANLFVWAVRPGDVGAVPLPTAVWLFGSGLIGLLGLARRQG